MEITTVVHTHGDPDVTWDTVDSVYTYMTDQVLLLVDGVGWDKFDHEKPPANMLKGFRHGHFKAPYRNLALGLWAAARHWPNSDWYAYMEYDCLIGSSAFREDLATAADQNVWIVGNDYREKEEIKVKFPLIELMMKQKFRGIYYLLGAVMFFHKNFMDKLLQENFFERLLYYTNDFSKGFFPGYEGPYAWDLSEHLFPTLAKHWGGNILQLSKWNENVKLWSPNGMWLGSNHKRYPIRFRPELELNQEDALQASILHPVKNLDNPIRIFHREKRLRKRNAKN